MDDLIKALKSSEPSVVCGAIEKIEKTNPALLKPHIVDLLLNANFFVRTRAARAMCRWDRSEAVKYFEAMLCSPRVSEREAALAHSFFFPFEDIEPILLKFITTENEVSLLQRAGIVFMSNPDTNSAVRLYEAYESTKGLRADIIGSTIKGILNSLYQAGIVAKQPTEILKSIKLEYRNKKIKIYVNHFSSLLASEDPNIRLKAAMKLCDLVRQNVADVNILISQYLKTETDENIRNQIRLYWVSGASKQQLTELIDIKNSGQRQRLYASINENSYSEAIQLILPELETFDSAEKLMVLGFIEKYGSILECPYIVSCLASEDSAVRQATIDCLAKLDQETLYPYLAGLLRDPSDEVKLSAIKAYSVFDKKQAVNVLEEMMDSPSTEQRRTALFCLSYLDFASVSDILLSAFRREKNDKNKEQIQDIILNNPELDIFIKLFFDSKTVNNEQKPVFEDLCKKLSQRLALNGLVRNSEEAFNIANSRWEEECKLKATREEYRFERIQSLRHDLDTNKESTWELIRFAIIWHSIGLIITAIIWFGFMSPKAIYYRYVADNEKSEIQTKAVDEASNVVLPTEPINIKGTVIDSSNEFKQASLTDSNGNEYMLTFPENMNVPTKGSVFSAQIFVEDYENGIFIAQVLAAF